MANEVTKCPMCGTKLKMTDGRMTCKKCGYYTRSQTGQTDSQNAAQYNSGQMASGQYSSFGQAASGQYSSSGRAASEQYSSSGQAASGQYSSSGRSSSAPKKNSEHNPVVAAVTAVILSVSSLLVLVVIVLFRTGTLDHMLPSGSSAFGSGGSSVREDQSSSQAQNSSASGSPAAQVSLPRSDFFRQVAETIWNKSYTDITAAEYSSLTALQISREDKVIYYVMGEGNAQSLSYMSDTGIDFADLSCFTGLQWLSVDDDLEKGDLDGLDYLYGVYAENTIEELAAIIPHPEYITDLGVEDSIFKKSLDGLEAFPNLVYFYADYGSLEDISALLQYPELQGLTLLGCDNLTDYSPLMSLNAMESLYLESRQLKSIDFVSEMPLLTELSVSNTQISSISALASCPELQYLCLTKNYDVKDYSVIGQLSRLQELDLELNYGGTLPSFEDLTELEVLTIKYAGDLSPLKDAVNVTYLALEECSGWELDAIASMQNLTTLVINDFSSYVDSLEPLTRLPNLTALSLENTSVFGNIEDIFGIPTLRVLYLDDCQVGLDFDRLPTNNTLEILSLNSISILYDPTYNNGNKVSLSDHYDMFEHFPNLKELDMASLKLDSIEFVENLPLLQYLDITDNNVTSLKPLEALSDFRAVWCARNTILENLPEDSDILVITSE